MSCAPSALVGCGWAKSGGSEDGPQSSGRRRPSDTGAGAERRGRRLAPAAASALLLESMEDSGSKRVDSDALAAVGPPPRRAAGSCSLSDVKSLGARSQGARLERMKASPRWAGEGFRNVHP